MNSRIEQIIEEIEEYVESCKYQPLSTTKIVVNKEELEEFINSILENPEGTCIGFPYEMEDESNRYLEERKIVGIIVHHNADIKFSMN